MGAVATDAAECSHADSADRIYSMDDFPGVPGAYHNFSQLSDNGDCPIGALIIMVKM